MHQPDGSHRAGLTCSSWAPCSLISDTKSVIGRGVRGAKFFLDSVTSVGHSSSGGRPISLKPHVHSNTATTWIVFLYTYGFLLTQRFSPVDPLLILHRRAACADRMYKSVQVSPADGAAASITSWVTSLNHSASQETRSQNTLTASLVPKFTGCVFCWQEEHVIVFELGF